MLEKGYTFPCIGHCRRSLALFYKNVVVYTTGTLAPPGMRGRIFVLALRQHMRTIVKQSKTFVTKTRISKV